MTKLEKKKYLGLRPGLASGSLMNYQQKPCEVCGKLYRPTGAAQKYCEECAEKRRKMKRGPASHEPKKCEWCDKIFTPRLSTQKYCTPDCQCQHKLFHQRSAKGLQKRECIVCGKEFETYATRQVFCTERCRKKYSKTEEHMCVVCGKTFWAPRGDRPRCPACEVKPQTKSDSQLARFAKEAEECGMDYGTYRALRTAGKSYEELRAMR